VSVRIKLLTTILLFGAGGGAWADDSIVDKWEENNSSATKTISVNELICPSGWKKSNYALRDYHNNVLDRYMRVDVCPDNGLLRIPVETALPGNQGKEK